jgi:hypothetical protein
MQDDHFEKRGKLVIRSRSRDQLGMRRFFHNVSVGSGTISLARLLHRCRPAYGLALTCGGMVIHLPTFPTSEWPEFAKTLLKCYLQLLKC